MTESGSSNSASEVPLAFVDLMGCGLGAMLVLLFTALTPMGLDEGSPLAVASLTAELEYTMRPAKPGVVISINGQERVIATDRLVIDGTVRKSGRFDSGSARISQTGENPQITINWSASPKAGQPGDTKWTWTVTMQFRRRVETEQIGISIPTGSLKPARIMMQGLDASAQQFGPVAKQPDVRVHLGKSVTITP